MKKMIKASKDIGGLQYDVYTALADVAFDWQDASKEEMKEAIDWFLKHFYEEDNELQIVLKESEDNLEALTEADAETIRDDIAYIVEQKTLYTITTSSASLDDEFTVRIELNFDGPILPKTAAYIRDEVSYAYPDMIVSIER